MPEFRPGAGAAPGRTRELEADSHGMVAVGAGGTVVGDTVVASIVLPAGPSWNIYGLFGQVVPATATAAEFIGGHVRIDATAGDLEPNPAPVRFPVPYISAFLGATADASVSPLQIHPITFTAPGKAAIDLIYSQDIACTVAPQIVMGIQFGKTVPILGRSRYCDRVVTTLTAAGDTAVGTITLAEKASRITALIATLAQDGVVVAGEELLGFCRLDSDDFKMAPAQYPFSAAIGAGLGVAIDAPPAIVPVRIPLSIPVLGGARVDCFVDLNTAVTNACQASIYLEYE